MNCFSLSEALAILSSNGIYHYTAFVVFLCLYKVLWKYNHNLARIINQWKNWFQGIDKAIMTTIFFTKQI
jgi:hypothetical protein